jgi:hypothetical protein
MLSAFKTQSLSFLSQDVTTCQVPLRRGPAFLLKASLVYEKNSEVHLGFRLEDDRHMTVDGGWFRSFGYANKDEFHIF